jgi:hypothetical protein
MACTLVAVASLLVVGKKKDNTGQNNLDFHGKISEKIEKYV